MSESNTIASEKLKFLREQRARLEERIKRAEQLEANKKRKSDTRLKVLIGAAFLADCAKNSETAEEMKTDITQAEQFRKKR